MATSDELLQAFQDLKIDYDRSPADDGLPYSPNWHYDMLKCLQSIEYSLRIKNELYRVKNGITLSTTST